ncbi:hypothetical protein G7Y89_g14807 [Cudoniella acicularis]|uniref:Uncharacterized protein n=1 Tax=Cudoniella acicularis TaxID=354080 RepID=A0A8H4QYA9_9HELO|nr:hypothetical protein G7Y89_g14807 [Cudoniella acicularis]
MKSVSSLKKEAYENSMVEYDYNTYSLNSDYAIGIAHLTYVYNSTDYSYQSISHKWQIECARNVTIATVSTIVYEYNHTAITSVKTVSANTTATSVVTTDSATVTNADPSQNKKRTYMDLTMPTSFIYGTVFTDPYGSTYESPTPIIRYEGIEYTEIPATQISAVPYIPTMLTAFPSGFYTGEMIIQSSVPDQLLAWMTSHSPSNAPSYWTNLDQCSRETTRDHKSQVFAHQTVNFITATEVTTSTMTGAIGTNFEVLGTPQTSKASPSFTEAPITGTTVLQVHEPVTSSSVSQVDISLTPASSSIPITLTVIASFVSNNEAIPDGSSQATTGTAITATASPGSSPASIYIQLAPSTSSPAAPPQITIGTSTYTPNSVSAFVIGSQTLTAGGSIIVSASGPGGISTTIALPISPTEVVVNGATQALQNPPASTTQQQHLVLGSSTLTQNSASAFLIGTQTLTPGSQITASGTTISLAAEGSSVVINGNTQALQSPVPTTTNFQPQLIIGSSTYTANSASVFVVGTQTLAPGAQITASGTTISLATGGSSLIVNGNTQAVQTLRPTTTQLAPQLIVGSSTYTANSASAFVIGSQTLAPGSQITAQGKTLSLAPSGSTVIVNGTPQTLQQPTKTTPPYLVIGTSTYTPNSASAFVIGTQTLAPGSIITASGTTLSLALTGSKVVINGETSTLRPPPSLTTTALSAPYVTIDSSTYTLNSKSDLVIASQTLLPGSAITVSGTTISLPTTGSNIIINGATQIFQTPSPTSTAAAAAISNTSKGAGWIIGGY